MAISGLSPTMRGVIIKETGGTEVLEYKIDLPLPTLEPNQVLVRNSYIGINYIDTYFRTGLYKAPSFPYILGREAEGTIVAFPPTSTSSSTADTNLRVGDRVVYLGENTYAEYTAASVEKIIAIPPSIPEAIPSAILLQGLTALTLIREAHPVKAGEWILVHAAAGGVGLILCQMLHRIGANVIATASTSEKRDLAIAAGAKVAIGYDEEEIRRTVQDKTNGQGVSAVFDGVGKSTFDVSLLVIARKGTMVSFGNASGAVEPFAISRLSAGNIKVLRPTLFNYIYTRDELEQYVEDLWGFLSGEEKLKVKIHEVYPLEDVKRAHEELEGRRSTGKLLLRL